MLVCLIPFGRSSVREQCGGHACILARWRRGFKRRSSYLRRCLSPRCLLCASFFVFCLGSEVDCLEEGHRLRPYLCPPHLLVPSPYLRHYPCLVPSPCPGHGHRHRLVLCPCPRTRLRHHRHCHQDHLGDKIRPLIVVIQQLMAVILVSASELVSME